MKNEQIITLGVTETAQLIKDKKVLAVDVAKAYLKQIEKYKDKNAILEIFDDCLKKAAEIDKKIENNQPVGRLAGVPFIIKDNILYQGKKATCASKFMQNFVSPYTATALQKLLNEDIIVLGRANMDEFAMGGSTENSAFGNCKNAHNNQYVSGGSSGGSAVAVACNMCAAALGTDTGGSVRQPSSFNGVVGLKPTYGRISRYGVVAFASSLDQVGPITKNVQDNAYLLQILAGEDKYDATATCEKVDTYVNALNSDITNFKIGICKQLIERYKSGAYYKNFALLLDFLKQNNIEIIEIDMPNIEITLPVYYILSTAEAASNLGRFDGIKYTTQSQYANDINDVYMLSRSEGFGAEVKRRILFGNYVLSSGYYDAYYTKAKKAQQYIIKQFNKAFEKCHVMLTPTTYGEAFKIGEKSADPVSMYLEDLFTATANIARVPAISVPYSKGNNNLPLGVQIIAKQFDEKTMFAVADFIQNKFKGGKNAN